MTSSASAINLSMQWGHLVVENGEFDEEEHEEAEWICDYIFDLFDYDYWAVCEPINAYWNYTTDDYVGQCLDWQNNPVNNVGFVTNWWVGDFYHPSPYTPEPLGHFAFYGHGEGTENGITDTFVYDHAADASLQWFDFIWTCANGGRYWNDSEGHFYNISGITYGALSESNPGPTNINDEYGFFDPNDNDKAVGMPLAWTGVTNLNLDGYHSTSGDYCYIGFEGISPFMKNNLEGTEISAKLFAMAFYIYLLGYETYYQHQSIAASLDYASDYAFDLEFGQTPFYSGYWVNMNSTYWFTKMRVFGNGGIVLY